MRVYNWIDVETALWLLHTDRNERDGGDGRREKMTNGRKWRRKRRRDGIDNEERIFRTSEEALKKVPERMQ